MIYPDYIPDPIRREPMGKTVTVEVEIPDGWEPNTDGIPLMRAYRANDGVRIAGTLPVRPIPAEKTWERPEWLSSHFEKLKMLCGTWRVFDGTGWVPLNTSLLSNSARADLPSIDNLPPAERIWRIVEGGQG